MKNSLVATDGVFESLLLKLLELQTKLFSQNSMTKKIVNSTSRYMNLIPSFDCLAFLFTFVK